MKTKSSTATKAASAANAANGLETSKPRKQTLTVAAPMPPTAQLSPAQPTRAEPRSPQDISTDMIAMRAYDIWVQEGRPQGHDVANWLLAENQLKQERSFSA